MQEFDGFAPGSAEGAFQEGLDLLESDHFEEALRAFDYVLDHQPYNADALFHRGIALVNLSRPDEAVESYRLAIKQAPTEALYHSHCGYALMVMGRGEEAVGHFDYALQLQPDGYQNKVYKACVLAGMRQFQAARELLEEVLEERPDDIEVLRHHGAVLAALGEDEDALRTFAAILRQNPNHVEAITRRGDIYLRAGRRDEAMRCLREAVALNPSDGAAYIALMQCLRADGNPAAVIATASDAVENGHEHPEVYMMRGTALLEQHQVDRAITDLRRARELDDRNAEAHFHLARAYVAAGRIRQAMGSAGRAVQIQPGDARFLRLKAELHHRAGEYAAELQYLRPLLAAEPGDYGIVRCAVECLTEAGRGAEAIALLHRFLAREPHHLAALVACARLSETLGLEADARQCYEKVFRGGLATAREFAAYAGFLKRQGSLREACRLLEAGVAEYPRDTALVTGFASLLLALGRHDDCVEALRRYRASGRMDASLCRLMGLALAATGEDEEALANFAEARRRDSSPGGASSAAHLGSAIAEAHALRRLGRSAEGARTLARLEGGSAAEDPEYHSALGELREHAGDQEGAAAAYEDGIRRFPRAASLHLRLARLLALQRRRSAAMAHLREALALDERLAPQAAAEPAFRRHAWRPSMWRILGPGLVGDPVRLAFATLAAAAALGAALNSLMR
jgi:tetratricopeptide (TPR) repeat protein